MLKLILPLLFGFVVLGIVYVILTQVLEVDVKGELSRRMGADMPEELPEELMDAVE
ncbi:MAG TPA: hypothetical protein VLA23_00850 [Candidatus Limnocylindrales bacterium]|nr:hypothetical protein [Candidatus Limnocylindrales bacterium]